ncbi:uncharacterized protein LOC134948207 [Pseudophryne corroboree]|uniref:uncharacterized protein LOC134948207 n=1 Tax=Pseudophryne corroboree TaxID=495146 RepID=UPI003081F791
MQGWNPGRMDPVEDVETQHEAIMTGAVEHDDMPSTCCYTLNSQPAQQMSSTLPERRGPVEDDETQPEATMNYDTSYRTLRSLESYSDLETFSYRNLQISVSVPPTGPGFQWSQDVLSAFGSLPDFSPEERRVLVPLVGPPATPRPLSVREGLLAFQREPGYYQHLRALAQKLKSVGRVDVVKAMHKEKSALRWLGPVLPEEHLVKDIVPSLWVPLTTALSISHPEGHDWRLLAQEIHIPREHIDLWQERERNPGEMVLRTWQVKVTEATVGRLFDLIIKYREDLAAML